MTAQIYWIDSTDKDQSAGRLGLMAKPDGSDCIERQFDSIAGQGVNLIVSLLETAEASEAGLANEAVVCRARGIEFIQFGIPDYGLPQNTQAFVQLVQRVDEGLSLGCNAVAHCWGGIGRSGMLCTALLVCRGDSLANALARLASARGVPVPETAEQVVYLESIATQLCRSRR